MSTTFNTLDLIFFAFTAIFVITAILRGFVKEIFALFNWVVALVFSYLLTPFVADFLAPHFDSKLAIDLVVRSGLFALFFVISIFSTSNLRDTLYEKMPRMFDRSLGMLFGFFKTLLIFGVIYSIYSNAYLLVLGSKLKEKKQDPAWFEQAKSRSLIKSSGEIVNPLVKKLFESVAKNFEQIAPSIDQSLDGKIDEIMKEKKPSEIDDVHGLSDSELEKNLDTGYTKKNIEKLNQLMDVINK